MGIAYKLSCHRCGYESDLLYLGQGMAMLPEQIVGTCTCCDNLTTISINESYGVCSLCGAKDRVIFTSYQHGNFMGMALRLSQIFKNDKLGITSLQ